MIIIGITDLIGRLKAKSFPQHMESIILENGVNFCSYLLCTNYDMSFFDNSLIFNSQNGFGDINININNKEKREIILINSKNQEQKIIFYFGEYKNILIKKDEKIDTLLPRDILKSAINLLIPLEITIKAGIELEFYVFKQKPFQDNFDNIIECNLYSDYSADFLIDFNEQLEEITNLLSNCGIAIESFKHEASKGQIEIAFKYDDLLQVADNIIISKLIIKNYFNKKNMYCTFMAKPSIHLNGSGLHLHLSLHKKNKTISEKDDIFILFYKGILKYINDYLCFYLPNINSYKRLIPNSWVPLINNAEHDNRNALIRIINNNKINTRFEFRLAGSDANIYLALSALIFSGVYNIKYHNKVQRDFRTVEITNNMFNAINYFKNSKIMQYFLSNEIIQHLTYMYENEFNLANGFITNIDYQRYF